MVALGLYFQVHQPYRLRRFDVFDTAAEYFDHAANRRYMQAVAQRCYLPANRVLMELRRRYGEAFRVSMSISGTALEQFEAYCPEALASFQALAATGGVEFLCETYYHSLAFLYSPEEFREQIKLHRRTIKRLFGQTPRVFRNTNLIYSNDIGRLLAPMKLNAALIEGWEEILGPHNPAYVYQAPRENLALLLRHYHLSEDVALRFPVRTWSQWPLTADKYARWLHGINREGVCCLVGMDYETFGERHSADTGIFDFLAALPEQVLALGDSFKTASECVAAFAPKCELSVPRPVSWTDTQRDLSPWLGNAMQANALQEVYRLEEVIKTCADGALPVAWRKLTTSDHYFYMNTRYMAVPGGRNFTDYDSPYEAYMNFMNVLDHLATRARP